MKDKKETAPPVYDVVEDGELFALHRNGRYLMTPKGNAFRMPNKALTDALADEWRGQGEKINVAQMPMTQLAATALDIISKEREKIVRGLLAYIASELLCHRVDDPPTLVAKQQEHWQPLLDWCRDRYDVSFCTGSGVMPIAQKPDVTQRISTVISSFDDFRLAGLSSATDSAGSLVLGLALAEKVRTADEIFTAAELDIDHQAGTWGDDPVTLARQAMVKADLIACERWFALLG